VKTSDRMIAEVNKHVVVDDIVVANDNIGMEDGDDDDDDNDNDDVADVVKVAINEIGVKKPFKKYTIADVSKLFAAALPVADSAPVMANGVTGELLLRWDDETIKSALGITKFQLDAFKLAIEKVVIQK
jgi:hypothetical protein